MHSPLRAASEAFDDFVGLSANPQLLSFGRGPRAAHLPYRSQELLPIELGRPVIASQPPGTSNFDHRFQGEACTICSRRTIHPYLNKHWCHLGGSNQIIS
jgi:hypothetical protein